MQDAESKNEMQKGEARESKKELWKESERKCERKREGKEGKMIER